jgi:hypothetical protein
MNRWRFDGNPIRHIPTLGWGLFSADEELVLVRETLVELLESLEG